MTQVKLVRNRIPQLRQEFPKRLQARLTEAMHDLRSTMADDLKGGSLPINSDTMTLAESLAVQTKGPLGEASDAKARMQAAKSAYLNNPSRWAEAVRAYVTPEAYTDAHFSEREANEEPLPTTADIMASVLTLWWVGFLWENGHNNVFTGRYEQRAWLRPGAIAWAAGNLEKFFANILK